jgi:hypothetical protein
MHNISLSTSSFSRIIIQEYSNLWLDEHVIWKNNIGYELINIFSYFKHSCMHNIALHLPTPSIKPHLTRGVIINNVINLSVQGNVVNGNVLMTDEKQSIEVIISKRPTQSPLPVKESLSSIIPITDSYKWDLPVILNTNVRSLLSKTDEVELTLQQNNVAIAGITETWCTSDQPTTVFSIEGYNIVRRDRQEKRGGGVMCYIKSSIPYKTWPLLDDGHETIWITARPCKLPRNFSIIVFGILYHPPGANNRSMTIHIETTSLDTLLKEHPYAGIVIIGDFNSLPEKYLKSA